MITRSRCFSRRRPSLALPGFAIINNHGFSSVGANLVFAPNRAITRIAPTLGIEKEQYIRFASIIYVYRGVQAGVDLAVGGEGESLLWKTNFTGLYGPLSRLPLY